LRTKGVCEVPWDLISNVKFYPIDHSTRTGDHRSSIYWRKTPITGPFERTV